MREAADGRAASFGEFGVAMVAEVFTPGFLRHQLDTALHALPRRTDWLPEFAGDIASARTSTSRLLADDGSERSFAVTIQARLEAEVGPRLLAMGIDALVEIDLTVRLRAFRPAIVQLDVDPVSPDDVRIRGRARSDWLPLALAGDDMMPGLAELAGRSLPILTATLNRALDATTSQRRVDVLERVRRWQGEFARSDVPQTGTLGPDQTLEWSIELAEQERVRLQLWAAISPQLGADPAAPPPPPAASAVMELSILDAHGEPVDQLRVPVRRIAPDFDTTATGPGVTATASTPGGYRARLANHATRPVIYRLEQHHTTVPGQRIDFAEFGQVLIHRGIDRAMVSTRINQHLAPAGQIVFDARPLIRGTVAARLTDVHPEPARTDQLGFRVTLLLDVQLLLGPGANATTVTSTLRADVAMRVWTTVEPAAVVMDFAAVADRDLRITQPPRRVRGRRIPIPAHTLTELIPGRVAGELNRKLTDASRRIVAAQLATTTHPLDFADTTALRRRTSFTGVASTRHPQSHTIHLAAQQRIRAKARITARPTAPTGKPGTHPDDLAAELTLCDEHCGVCASDQAPIPNDGQPKIIGIEFTAPHAGEWRLRVACVGRPWELDYDLQIRPQI